MKRVLPPLLDMAHLLALAAWLGGLLTLWLAVMPAAFHTSGLTLREAETVASETLRRFAPLVEVCGLTMAAAQFLLRRRYQRDKPRFLADGMRQILTFGALLAGEFCLRSLLPQMDAARQQARVADFAQLHQGYNLLATAQVALLVGVAALTAWLQAPMAREQGKEVKGEGKGEGLKSALETAQPARTTALSKSRSARKPVR